MLSSSFTAVFFRHGKSDRGIVVSNRPSLSKSGRSRHDILHVSL